MTDKQFTFIMRSLRDKLRQMIHTKEICIEYQPEHPCPDDRCAMFVMTEDVDRSLIVCFNEILPDEYTI